MVFGAGDRSTVEGSAPEPSSNSVEDGGREEMKSVPSVGDPQRDSVPTPPSPFFIHFHYS